MSANDVASRRDNWITLLLGADAQERGALAWSFLCFFSLLLGYYILRSVREAMIAADGSHMVPAVFTSVFFCMLAITPVSLFFGWLADIYGRKGLLLAGQVGVYYRDLQDDPQRHFWCHGYPPRRNFDYLAARVIVDFTV